MRRAGAVVPRIVRPLLAKRGATLAGLVLDWPVIVGVDLAAVCVPERLTRDSLRLAVAPAAAIVLQHDAPAIVRKVNAYLGRAVVARLQLRQDPGVAPKQNRPRRVLRAGAVRVEGVADPRLRRSLERLGAAVARV